MTMLGHQQDELAPSTEPRIALFFCVTGMILGIPVAVGTVTLAFGLAGVTNEGPVAGILGAVTGLFFAVLVVFLTAPLGAIFGLMSSAVAVLARSPFAHAHAFIQTIVVACVAGASASACSWLVSIFVIQNMEDMGVEFAVAGAFLGGLGGATTEALWSLKQQSTNRRLLSSQRSPSGTGRSHSRGRHDR